MAWKGLPSGSPWTGVISPCFNHISEDIVSAVLHEGAAYHLPARFQSLSLACNELIEEMAREREKAAPYVESGEPYPDAADAAQRIRVQRYRTGDFVTRIEHDIVRSGTEVVRLLDSADLLMEVLEFIQYRGCNPANWTTGRRLTRTDVIKSITRASAEQYDRWSRRIQAEIHDAAAHITPRLNLGDGAGGLDFVFEVLCHDGVPKLLPSEIAFLGDFVASDGDGEVSVADHWARQRIRDILPALRLEAGLAEVEAQEPEADNTEAKAVGRTVAMDDYEARKLVAERWELFSRDYKTIGYRRGGWENFANWASERFDDMPSDNPEVLERMFDAYRKTPTPRNFA